MDLTLQFMLAGLGLKLELAVYHLLSRRSVDIAASAEAVFAYAANLENFPNWFPGALSIQAMDSLAVDEIGKTYNEIVALPFGRRAQVRIQVKEAERPIRIITEGNYRMLLPRMEMRLQSLGEGGSRMEWKMYSRRTGVIIQLLLPVFRLVVGARSRVALARLKALLEGAG